MDRVNKEEMPGLWYGKPADSFEDALPIGNGRLGGMVCGGTEREIVHLNEDTLWSGYPRDTLRYGAADYLKTVRELISAGQPEQAQQIIENNMTGLFWNQSFLPMGRLILDFYQTGEITGYRRKLNMDTGSVDISYGQGGAGYCRKAFASHPDQVLVYRISTTGAGMLRFTVRMDSQLRHKVSSDGLQDLYLDGVCPGNVVPHYVPSEHPVVYGNTPETSGMRFRMGVRVLHHGGTVSVTDDSIEVCGADDATILLSAATSFNGCDRHPHTDGKDEKLLCGSFLMRAAARDYPSMLQDHEHDFSIMFKRVDISFAHHDDMKGRPTDERLADMRNGGEDPQLFAILFQYGRYLLMSSSREGTQPANLQGIWNQDVRPYWSCNLTTNINAQMNYWLAETCSLPECHLPFIEMVNELRLNDGGMTAVVHYGAKGWVAHHNADIWRTSTPAGGGTYLQYWACCLFWPMGAAWLCQHLWEHYAFSLDTDYLAEKAYPTMKEAARFCLDWLVEDGSGHLTTNPSTSPENSFIAPTGGRCGVGTGSAMDLSVIFDLFSNCIDAAGILDVDAAFRAVLEQAIIRLAPLGIGSKGQILEWQDEYEEFEPNHRHFSHLFGLYPGHRVQMDGSRDDLVTACRESVRWRVGPGGMHGGWGLAWLANLNARLQNAEDAYDNIAEMLKNAIHMNMLNICPPGEIGPTACFTIESNFGAAAGIAEMLVQSHAGELHLLPALPHAWHAGHVRGLRARGGYRIDMAWKDGALLEAEIVSGRNGACLIRCAGNTVQIQMRKGFGYLLDPNMNVRLVNREP